MNGTCRLTISAPANAMDHGWRSGRNRWRVLTGNFDAGDSLVGIVVVAVIVGDRRAAVRCTFFGRPSRMIAGGHSSPENIVTGPEPIGHLLAMFRPVQLQLARTPRSRTTWILELNGKIYVPCGSWTARSAPDGNTGRSKQNGTDAPILRIDGKRYPRAWYASSTGRYSSR